ncbi:ferredoxin reductase [Phytomonospora sp. NPDC050363]|uniref:ferredoxin reductase n=1 Tax=Phytomonospora sp. NPDC050363 TaxID=3155642 RepID=UPI0033F64E08
MAGRALPAGLVARRGWRTARLASFREETPTARTLVLEVPGWPGHLAGQHVDVRLTAEDGYSAERAYSLAGPAVGERIELTVQALPDGEVSPFLAGAFALGDPVEIRGPVGGWFTWRPEETAPVLLVAGGSGVVPLAAMVRARRASGSRAGFRLVYSVRTPEDVFYREELTRPVVDGVETTVLFTRAAPPGASRGPGRITAADLGAHGWPPEFEPHCFVCGPTGFVETVADILVAVGHSPDRIKTERFGGR